MEWLKERQKTDALLLVLHDKLTPTMSNLENNTELQSQFQSSLNAVENEQ